MVKTKLEYLILAFSLCEEERGEMVRYKAVIAYDGTNYHGFQVQERARTVQEEIEKVLAKLNSGQAVMIFASGRTDAGVHAMGQVIHFDFPEVASIEKLRFGLDTQTPEDIAVKEIEMVPDDFHARYHVREKTYQFRVDVGKPRNPFKRFYASYFPYALEVDRIQASLDLLLGTHDFTGFCASGSSVEDKTRTIYEAKVEYLEKEQELLFTFRGDGFLYKMVRIIVGTALKIGNGRLPIEQMTKIIETKNRQLTGPTAHPEGLYLVKVDYD